MSTEQVDPRYVSIDCWPSVSAVEAMLEGQMAAIAAIKSQVATIASAAEAAARRLGATGRLIYAGAGTSGRVAVQDGVELFPTYNWPRERLVFLMAGGSAALTESVEGAEDDAAAGREAVAQLGVEASDVVIGVAASGRTPYTLAVTEAAREAGALTIGVANNPGVGLLTKAEHAILADTGSEIVAGSTRMKAGTAQKAVLNLLSTTIMLRRGLVHQGLMVNMRVSNRKLRGRAEAMVSNIAGVSRDVAAAALDRAGEEIRRAVLVALGASADEADDLLVAHDGALAGAMAALRPRQAAEC
ncbi:MULTISPECIES: N-acetylmuramic acid 6-phosphate etherase [unclassified Sphingomonas]|uniref:N-acetylmuramic acid 6-phosphate etherase n=1 Tax=unclassified Sphingomonas TaxID=196159 RepID=UPI001D0FA440|nr:MULTISPECIES: N-acetylmuramic acid 6-phosphate etherase [unclassified Sphingomonas]MCC2978544.1 N-acetylmuramic acid 6-phosphate etherase [Sphingomonas sp. IC4-52]MCD2316169.1 N-acetylmuramic acid 6-phosphate etherase [Sphingomonas sp. IC-11]